LKTPAQLNERVLAEIATLCSSHFQIRTRNRSALHGTNQDVAKGAVKALVRELISLYGHHRWRSVRCYGDVCNGSAPASGSSVG